MKNSSKALALLVNQKFKDAQREDKQALLRACASQYGQEIISFLAMSKINIKRLKQALLLCKRSGAKTIILDDFQHIFLEPKDLIDFLSEIADHGMGLIDAKTKAFFESAHIKSMKQLFFISIKAKNELHKDKIKRSLRKKKQEGVRLGAHRFGDKPEEYEIMKYILELHKTGLSLNKICSYLNLREVKSAHHRKWYPTTVKRIIERR